MPLCIVKFLNRVLKSLWKPSTTQQKGLKMHKIEQRSEKRKKTETKSRCWWRARLVMLSNKCYFCSYAQLYMYLELETCVSVSTILDLPSLLSFFFSFVWCCCCRSLLVHILRVHFFYTSCHNAAHLYIAHTGIKLLLWALVHAFAIIIIYCCLYFAILFSMLALESTTDWELESCKREKWKQRNESININRLHRIK